jgi:hypothetical protein
MSDTQTKTQKSGGFVPSQMQKLLAMDICARQLMFFSNLNDPIGTLQELVARGIKFGFPTTSSKGLYFFKGALIGQERFHYGGTFEQVDFRTPDAFKQKTFYSFGDIEVEAKCKSFFILQGPSTPIVGYWKTNDWWLILPYQKLII